MYSAFYFIFWYFVLTFLALDDSLFSEARWDIVISRDSICLPLIQNDPSYCKRYSLRPAKKSFFMLAKSPNARQFYF